MTTTLPQATDVGSGAGHRPVGPAGDMCRDILSEAYRPGAAPPVAVHIRPELRRHVLPHAGTPRSPSPLPLVVDAALPTAPGYEIHRAPPAAPRRH